MNSPYAGKLLLTGELFLDNIVFREAEIDDAEKMISYLNIVGRESDNLMHGSNGFNVPIEAKA